MKNMPTKFSLVFAFFASVTASNPAWAEEDADYINALGDEAKITKMKDETTVLESVSEPAVLPNKSTDINKLSYEVTRKLQQTLGTNTKADGKKAIVENELEKMISSALAQGNKMDDIRSTIDKVLVDIKADPGQPIEAKTLESISKALNQIAGKSKDVTSDKPIDNSIPSQPVSIKSSGKQDNESDTASMEQVSSERTITVMKNESLSIIAQRVYGSDKHFMLLYKANRDTITNPDIIQIGQVLKVPKLP